MGMRGVRVQAVSSQTCRPQLAEARLRAGYPSAASATLRPADRRVQCVFRIDWRLHSRGQLARLGPLAAGPRGLLPGHD